VSHFLKVQDLLLVAQVGLLIHLNLLGVLVSLHRQTLIEVVHRRVHWRAQGRALGRAQGRAHWRAQGRVQLKVWGAILKVTVQGRPCLIL